MPDTRAHRGPHPEDATSFAPAAWPALQLAHADLCWLLDHGYARTSALQLVGNRHRLTRRQREAVLRCACTAEERTRRLAAEVAPGGLGGAEVWIDGYNLLIGLESALGGGVILQSRDGCFRDLASLHGTYRQVGETVPALQLAGETFARWGVARCRWLLDRPVSNSGRLRILMLELAAQRGWSWDVDLEFNPDTHLAEAPVAVATSDSLVLERCARWVNATRVIITGAIPGARIVDLSTTHPMR